jgi:hypothetical protein
MMRESMSKIASFCGSAALIAGLLFLAQASAAAQPGSFIVAQHGKQVGDATVTFRPTAKGFESTSIVHVSMQGLNYAISKDEELTAANQLNHAQLSATVNNTAVSLTATRDNAQFLLNVSANGRSSTLRLASHPAAVFLPDFDPGALDTLLALAATQNSRDLWAIIPKQTGAQAGAIEPVQLVTYADEAGTLDGKPVTVHHLVATIGGAKTDLFSGPANQLLQGELPQVGFAVVRKGFVLTPPRKAGAPPATPPQAGQTPQSANPPAPTPVQQ